MLVISKKIYIYIYNSRLYGALDVKEESVYWSYPATSQAQIYILKYSYMIIALQENNKEFN